jgi:septation ring formation regulator EzrA
MKITDRLSCVEAGLSRVEAGLEGVTQRLGAVEECLEQVRDDSTEAASVLELIRGMVYGMQRDLEEVLGHDAVLAALKRVEASLKRIEESIS